MKKTILPTTMGVLNEGSPSGMDDKKLPEAVYAEYDSLPKEDKPAKKEEPKVAVAKAEVVKK